MLKCKTQLAHSECKPFQEPFPYSNGQCFQHYILAEHFTSASLSPHKVVSHAHRPHVNVKLDNAYSTKALIDSGSTISLADSTLIKHLKNKFPMEPAVNVTGIHNDRQITMGGFQAKISIEDPLPYPVIDRDITIQMTHHLSSELILGADFLCNNGAIVNMRTNKVTFIPDQYFPISLNQKPMVCEAFASLVDNNINQEELISHSPATFAVEPMKDMEIVSMDQKVVHIRIISNNHSMTYKPETTIMLTSGIPSQPHIQDGLYSIEHDGTIRVTIKNPSTSTLQLRQNRPIEGIVAHDLQLGYHQPVEISKNTLRALFLKDMTVQVAKLAGILPESAVSTTNIAANSADFIDPTPEEYIASVEHQFQEASSLLQASGLEPPGNRSKPRQAPTLSTRTNLKSQFDSSGIEKEWLDQYIDLIMKNWDVFSLHRYDVGHTPHWEHKIESTSSDPVYVKQFKIAVGDEEALDEMATHLTAAKILIQQPSDNNTPIFMVAKRGGTSPGQKRFVQDFRKRNAASKDDKYTIKDVRESLVAVGRLKPKIWSKLDFTGAFYCLSLEKSSQKLTSFTLPFKNAQYSWARMPQGLKGASASFSKLCQIIFRHIPNIITYVDDLVGATTNHKKMIELLDEVFAECRYHGMKLNLKKCQFGLKSLSWLGYNLAENGISPEIDKAEAVKSMVLPTTIKEIQSHLGLFQFFSELIDKYALIAGPLSSVTSPEHPWRSYKLSGDLPQDAIDSWYKLRNIIASRPVIAFPDFSLPFQLFVDASVGKPHADPPIRGGVGAILTQVQHGVTRAIGYFSRQFRDSESRYNAYNAELCGLVAALDHFMTYIKSSTVTAFTDHMPLVKAASKEKATADALLHKLSIMDLELVHIVGPSMPADALSRQAKEAIKGKMPVAASSIMEALPEAMSDLQWKFEQSQDAQCKIMKAWIKNQKISPSPYMTNLIKLFGPDTSIDQNNGLLYLYSSKNKSWPRKRLWVPDRLRSMIIANHHGSTLGGHWKEEITFNAIANKYFWPLMARDVEDHVKLCKICHQQANRSNSKDKAPLRPWGPPTARNQRIHFDLVGPLKESQQEFRHILTVTDVFSRWVELIPIKDKEAITVAQALWDHWICRFGFYRQSVSDGGGEFHNGVLQELSKLMKSKHHIISPYTPSVNGVIERVHRSLGEYIRSFCDEATRDWVELLPSLAFSLNTKVHSSTEFSPYFITYGEHPIFPWTPDDKVTYSENEIADRVRLLQYAHKLCHTNDVESKATMKRAFDVKTSFRKFKKGDSVLLYLPSPPVGENKKFYSPWRGIYQIVDRTSDLTYTLRKKGGRLRRAHVNRIKFYDPLNSIEDPEVMVHPDSDEPDSPQDKPQESKKTDKEDQIIENQRITRSKTNSLPKPIDRL